MKRVHIADAALEFCPAQPLCRFQAVKAGYKSVIGGDGDRVHHANLRNTLRKPLHVLRRCLTASGIDFNFVDMDKHFLRYLLLKMVGGNVTAPGAVTLRGNEKRAWRSLTSPSP